MAKTKTTTTVVAPPPPSSSSPPSSPRSSSPPPNDDDNDDDTKKPDTKPDTKPPPSHFVRNLVLFIIIIIVVIVVLRVTGVVGAPAPGANVDGGVVVGSGGGGGGRGGGAPGGAQTNHALAGGMTALGAIGALVIVFLSYRYAKLVLAWIIVGGVAWTALGGGILGGTDVIPPETRGNATAGFVVASLIIVIAGASGATTGPVRGLREEWGLSTAKPATNGEGGVVEELRKTLGTTASGAGKLATKAVKNAANVMETGVEQAATVEEGKRGVARKQGAGGID